MESADAGGIEDRIEKSFRVGSGGKLTLETNRGSVEVRTADADTLRMEVIRKVAARDREEAAEILKGFKIEWAQHGNDVHVHAEAKKDRGSFWGRRRLRLRFIASLPRKYNVDLKTSGGSISVDDLEGEVRSKTSGGSLRFGDILGPVWGKTSGGSITLAGCVGVADVETCGGSIKIGEVDGDIAAHTLGGSIHVAKARKSVVARTSGGSITVEEAMGQVEAKTSGGRVTARLTGQPQGDCYLGTLGGSIVVYLADGIAMDVDAKVTGGRVKTEFPVTVQGGLSRNRLNAKINGGGPELALRTSGGSIYLRKL